MVAAAEGGGGAGVMDILMGLLPILSSMSRGRQGGSLEGKYFIINGPGIAQGEQMRKQKRKNWRENWAYIS